MFLRIKLYIFKIKYAIILLVSIMKIRFHKYLKRLLIFLLALAFIFTVNGTIERQYVKREIRDFVSRAEYIAPGVLFDYDDTKERFYIVRKNMIMKM